MTPDYEQVFREIYATKRGGYGSGGGSCPSNCWPYLRLVERMLEQYEPATVLDIGCGDGRVAANIKWGSVRYIGIDVTDEPLELHRRRQVPGSRIYRSDALRDELPAADLVLTKEATQHMDIASVMVLMDRLRPYKRIIHASVVQGVANSEIMPGECRGIDLTIPPFELPAQTILRFQVGESASFLVQQIG